MLAPNTRSYNIRREKGLIRDPKTGKVGPNRSPGLRYTELADEMVVKFGRVGQKALKVCIYDCQYRINSESTPHISFRVGTIMIRKLAKAVNLCRRLKYKN